MRSLKIASLIAALFVYSASVLPVSAQGMPPAQIKQILDVTKANWVSFRDWQGKQLIYFTHLEAWRCGIDFVFYGLNNGPLDQMWELDPCNPANPNAVTKDMPYIELPAGFARAISVQLIYTDGTKSSVETFVYNPAAQ